MTWTAGIDVGSSFTKAVILRETDIFFKVAPSGGNYKNTVNDLWSRLLAETGIVGSDIKHTLATGCGAASVGFAGDTVTEITAGAQGAFAAFPCVRTVIDIGGQFTRVCRLDNCGRVINFVISEKCAAGSGRFLQVIARVLHIGLDDIGLLSLKSQKRVDFTTGCAVFAESEAVSRIAEGAAKEDILAGVHRAMAAKMLNLIQRAGPAPEYCVIGGGAKDAGLVQSITGLISPVRVPDNPQITAAHGAALIARQRMLSD